MHCSAHCALYWQIIRIALNNYFWQLILLQILSFKKMLNFLFLPWMEICQTTRRQRGASGGELQEGFPLSSRHADLEADFSNTE